MTDTVYIVTRYTEPSPGHFIASTKYEVTEEQLAAIYLLSIPEEDRDKDEFDLHIIRETIHEQ